MRLTGEAIISNEFEFLTVNSKLGGFIISGCE